MFFRQATSDDKDSVMKLIDEAKQYLKNLGVDQWQKEYPSIRDIEKDILAANGYILEDNDAVIAYACIDFNGEESYNTLDGKWLTNGSYAVIHRMAIDNNYKGKGLATAFFKYAEELCKTKNIKSIKVDTDDANERMKHILLKNGFVYCGTIRFDNSDKIAYEKLPD